MARVFVAMSGGVDSAAAALLALRAGHQVSGIHARMVRPADWGLAGLEEKQRQDAADAEAVARRLGIPFYQVDCCGVFREREKAIWPICWRRSSRHRSSIWTIFSYSVLSARRGGCPNQAGIWIMNALPHR